MLCPACFNPYRLYNVQYPSCVTENVVYAIQWRMILRHKALDPDGVNEMIYDVAKISFLTRHTRAIILPVVKKKLLWSLTSSSFLVILVN